MLSFKKGVMSLLLLTVFTAQANIVGTEQVLLGEYADDFWGGGYYTIENNSSSAITEFGVTTGQLNALGSSPWIDDFYPYSGENVSVAYSDDGWDYYLGDAWSASFFDETSWNNNFLESHGSYASLYGEEEGIAGVNWFYFDEIKFEDLWVETNKNNFYIDSGDVVGNELGSFFRFDSELASNFAAFNSAKGVTLVGTGSANQPTTVPEPSVFVLFVFGLLLLLRKSNGFFKHN
ncbi:hypothetical protein [Colwellia sp. UCD-KL20]|uniref:hypothetical protein n=1 Tax=Colwellia sp. UCD-KL20 TaxID=1917165 RepID=UPI0009704CD9|nr:hypothetical protein [Colwellia sp. UCD-KL20]